MSAPGSGLSVPLSTEAFTALVRSKVFTSGSDKALVVELYDTTLKTALGEATKMRYVGMSWGDDDVKQLLDVMETVGCKQLLRLNLKGKNNRFTDAASEHLANFLNDEKNLPALRVLGAGCTAIDAKDDGILMQNENLKRACQKRNISLCRDASCTHLAASANAAAAAFSAKKASFVEFSGRARTSINEGRAVITERIKPLPTGVGGAFKWMSSRVGRERRGR